MIVPNMETGVSTIIEQQMGNDSNQLTNEPDMGEIDDLIGVNQSFVATTLNIM